jgi:parallel beta-helix repeat protein
MQMSKNRRQIKANAISLIIALAITFVCATGWAATYYVDPAGSDSNNGLTSSTPWKTISKVNNTLFSAGDSILLKSGAVWREQLLVYSSGAASNPVTISSYGSGDKPTLIGSYAVSGWASAGSNIYTLAIASAPEVVSFNGSKGTRESSTSALDAANDWYWENGTLSVYATSAPSNVEVTTAQFLLAVASQSYVTIKNLTVLRGFYPVLIYHGSHVTLDNVTVADGAGAAGVYVIADDSSSAAYNTISNCLVYNINGSTDTIANDNNGCGIYLSGATASNNTVTGSTVHDCGHEGLVILSGSNNTFSGNTVYRTGSSGIRVALETASGNIIEKNESYKNCQKYDDRFGIDLIRVGNDNVVRYNLVHDQYDTLNDASIIPDDGNNGYKYGTGGIRFDGGNWEGHDYMDSTGNKAYYNVVFNERYGIESFNFSNVEMCNNTIYNSASYGVIVSSVFTVVCANNVVKNNIIHTAGEALIYHYRMDNTTIDNNVYYPDSSKAFIRRVDDVYYQTNFADWQAKSGFDSKSVAADPLFAKVASNNFSLQSSSPCVDAAQVVGFSTDFAGTRVPQGGTPDAGAFEAVKAAVADTTAPVITMLGSSPATVEVGSTYGDAGATAVDNVDGDITSKIVATNSVTTSVVGSYSVIYNVSDAAGNAAATITRTVKVVDSTKPVITLTGSASVTITAGSTYTDAGATAADNYDGNITSSIVKSGTVTTSTAGSYIITYNVKDSSGNAAAPVTRTVTVKAATDSVKPVITLIGSSTLKWKFAKTYVDPGATATDNVDGVITSKITKTSTVNVYRLGTFYVNYNVKDSAGNVAATVTRTVKVTLTGKEGDTDSDFFVSSPLPGSVMSVAGDASKVLVTLTANAPLTVSSVSYSVDGVEVGSSEAAPFGVAVEMDATEASYGEHSITATAINNGETITAESTFVIAKASEEQDANANGLPDNPFTALASDGDFWTQPMVVAENSENRAAAVARFDGSDDASLTDAAVALPVANAHDSTRGVTVYVPRALVSAGEIGIAVVQVADSIEALFGADSSVFLPTPDGLSFADGGQYMQVSVLLSADNGQTFDEVSQDSLAAHSVRLEAWGLPSDAAILRHSTYASSDASTGLEILGLDGVWAALTGVVAEADGLSVEVTNLSVFGTYQVTKDSEDQTAVAGCAGGSFAGSFDAQALGDVSLIALTGIILLVIGKRMSSLQSVKRH